MGSSFVDYVNNMSEQISKNFMLKCKSCSWSEMSTGIKEDLSNYLEIKSGCSTCGKYRKFKCPKCGGISLLKRVKGNT